VGERDHKYPYIYLSLGTPRTNSGWSLMASLEEEGRLKLTTKILQTDSIPVLVRKF